MTARGGRLDPEPAGPGPLRGARRAGREALGLRDHLRARRSATSARCCSSAPASSSASSSTAARTRSSTSTRAASSSRWGSPGRTPDVEVVGPGRRVPLRPGRRPPLAGARGHVRARGLDARARRRRAPRGPLRAGRRRRLIRRPMATTAPRHDVKDLALAPRRRDPDRVGRPADAGAARRSASASSASGRWTASASPPACT